MAFRFPHHRQLDQMDCGPTCLRMIAEHYGKRLSIARLREQCYIGRQGVSLLGISHAAEQIGFRTIAVRLTYMGRDEHPGLLEFPLPCIAHWDQSHFVVVYRLNKHHVWISDPAKGRIKMSRAAFEQHWCTDGQGIALGVEPTPAFYEEEGDEQETLSWSYLWNYVRPYKKLMVQFGLGLLVGVLLQLLFPFLTQSLIDVGVLHQNLSFVWLVLIAQLVLALSQAAVQFIQSWILLHIGRRINVQLMHDFLSKLMRLPLGFFDTKNLGDLYQRLQDNQRVEQFLTHSVMDMLFSMVSLVVFSVVLGLYNGLIFAVFFFFSFLYLGWVLLFMRWRRALDYRNFQQSSDNQQQLYEMIHGMQEIKLQGSEHKRRWRWVDVQAKLFHIQTKSLKLEQWQEFGGTLSSRVKDVLISFLAARAVIEGHMTLGMMMSVQYIVGQLNVPFLKMIQFSYKLQDTKISLERMNEVLSEADEQAQQAVALPPNMEVPELKIEGLNFGYTPLVPPVLNDLHLTIPKGKVTAIVGASGSGKTTLLKLLLGFYDPTEGKINIGPWNLQHLDKRQWRSRCGCVMQDGYLFSDTIANNIAESAEIIDYERLDYALRVANIHDYVYRLPLTYHTVIGAQGNGLSQGQRQRLLIARAVYKDPQLLFFDEATNALDATNEREIMEHLDAFFAQRTVVVVAHRLSTVRNADQIVVLQDGRITEVGRHEELLLSQGAYYQLIHNQLDVEQLHNN